MTSFWIPLISQMILTRWMKTSSRWCFGNGNYFGGCFSLGTPQFHLPWWKMTQSLLWQRIDEQPDAIRCPSTHLQGHLFQNTWSHQTIRTILRRMETSSSWWSLDDLFSEGFQTLVRIIFTAFIQRHPSISFVQSQPTPSRSKSRNLAPWLWTHSRTAIWQIANVGLNDSIILFYDDREQSSAHYIYKSFPKTLSFSLLTFFDLQILIRLTRRYHLHLPRSITSVAPQDSNSIAS